MPVDILAPMGRYFRGGIMVVIMETKYTQTETVD